MLKKCKGGLNESNYGFKLKLIIIVFSMWK